MEQGYICRTLEDGGVIDPKADDLLQVDVTPYNYSWNNPIRISDPDGECPMCIGAVVGALAEYGSQVATNLINGESESLGDALTNVSLEKVAVAGAVGAATLGLSSVKVIGTTAKIYKATAMNSVVAGGSMAKQKIDGNETVDAKEMVMEVVSENISSGIKNKGKTKTNKNENTSKTENNNANRSPERSDAMKQPDNNANTENNTGNESSPTDNNSSNSEKSNSSQQTSLDDKSNDLQIPNSSIKL